MQNVLADLALESEAALAIAMRIANSLDRLQQEPDNQHEKRFNRVATAIGKYWICKRTPQFTYEAMECIGGVAVVEDNILPRLYRESPINAIWEGSGNVQCLDVLRAVHKDPGAMDAFLAELDNARGRHSSFDAWLDAAILDLKDRTSLEYRARSVVEKLARAWQAATLIRFGPPSIAAAFVESRLTGASGQNYGTLPAGIDVVAVIQRSQVH